MSASTGKQVRRGEEAGAEVRAGLADQPHQPLRRLRPQFVGHQPEGQGAHVVGLGVRREGAVRPDELGPPRLQHVGGQLLEAPRLGVVAEHGGRCGRPARPSGAGTPCPPTPGPLHVVVGFGTRLEPFAPVVGPVPDELLVRRPARGGPPGGSGDGACAPPSRRSRPRTPWRARTRPALVVAVGAPHLPRDHHDGVAPPRRPLHLQPSHRCSRPLPQRVRRRS